MKIPNFGVEGTNTAIYCIDHKPAEYVDVKNRKCKHVGCITQPIFGKIEDNVAIYCFMHKPDDTYVNVKDNMCIYANCTTRCNFGKIEIGKAEYCALHKPDDTYVNLKSKLCVNEGCTHQPTYGFKGQKPLFCLKHKPNNNYINVRDKYCIDLTCKNQSSFGLISDGKLLYCSQHKPNDTYINLKKCYCVDPSCRTSANYNYIGFTAMYCVNHKEKNMILKPIKRCVICNNKASYVVSHNINNKEYYCYTHKTAEAHDFTEICIICSILVEPNKTLCDSCSSMNEGKPIKRHIKELQVKSHIENVIDIYSYDKTVAGGCSNKRPDFIIQTTWGNIVIEVDEFQHQRQSYSHSCEITRMKQIYFDIGNEKLLFIRYNPDNYKSNNNMLNIQSRLEILTNIVNEYCLNPVDTHLEVLYLFYDGYTVLNREIIKHDPYN